jgi:hypothetical protein
LSGAVDLCKGFEGLFGIVRDTLCLDPLSGVLGSLHAADPWAVCAVHRIRQSNPMVAGATSDLLASHAIGVSDCVSLTSRSPIPGSTSSRYSRTGTPILRHVSITLTTAATFGPAASPPIWIQFFRLCAIVHKRNCVRSLMNLNPAVRGWRGRGKW